jgi:hypothetical protein
MAFDYKFSKGEGEYNGKFTVGYSGRLKNRILLPHNSILKQQQVLLTVVDPNNLDLF